MAGAGRHLPSVRRCPLDTPAGACSMGSRWTSRRSDIPISPSLQRYCRLVAGGVGLMLGPVLGATSLAISRAGHRPRRGDAAHQRAPRRRGGPRRGPRLPARRRARPVRRGPRGPRGAAARRPSSCALHAVSDHPRPRALRRRRSAWWASFPRTAPVSPCGCCSAPTPASSTASSGWDTMSFAPEPTSRRRGSS